MDFLGLLMEHGWGVIDRNIGDPKLPHSKFFTQIGWYLFLSSMGRAPYPFSPSAYILYLLPKTKRQGHKQLGQNWIQLAVESDWMLNEGWVNLSTTPLYEGISTVNKPSSDDLMQADIADLMNMDAVWQSG